MMDLRQAGRDAFAAGYPIDHHPWPQASRECAQHRAGWIEAKAEAVKASPPEIETTPTDAPALRLEGISAYRAGLNGQEACPYPYGTAKCDLWWQGFWAAREGRA